MDNFNSLECFVLFVGYPRSGHSIVGAFLDAHEHIVVSHEFHALLRLDEGMGRDELFRSIIQCSAEQAKSGRMSGNYSYRIENSSQGTFTKLHVIGDKRGAGTVRYLAKDPRLLDRLQAMVKVPVKLLHVVRNPYDNIATIATRDSISIAEATDYYFEINETIASTQRRWPSEQWLTVHHESVIDDSRQLLTDICQYLGQPAAAPYLSACDTIVYRQANRSRLKAAWTEQDKRRVRATVEDRELTFLEEYRFEDERSE